MFAALGWLAEHATWLIPGVGPILGAGAAFLGKGWKLKAALIGGALVVGLVAVLWVRWDLADKRATIAEQGQAIQTLALERDQAADTARRNAAAVAELRRQVDAEAAARAKQRAAFEAALTQRDKILDEVRREKTARDPLPGAFRPLLGLR